MKDRVKSVATSLILLTFLLPCSTVFAEQTVTVGKASALDMQLSQNRLYITNLNKFKPSLPQVEQPPAGCCAGPFIDITTTGGSQMYSLILDKVYSNSSLTITLPSGNINNPVIEISAQ